MTRPLPIYEKSELILEALRHHRVVIVEGAAGCGKTTQIPRILAQAGLVPRRMGITQPRRIAAVSVAWRIAELEKTEVGEGVGYSIRFDDRTSPSTKIKVMTDGILLQEARHDPALSAYDVLMVDEAHERSLNIDFTLGLIKRVLKERDDIRVVISSATLHAAMFKRFFGEVVGDVPVVSIPSPTYPVTLRYSETEFGFHELVDETVLLIASLAREKMTGHILVFLPGEGSINRVQEGLVAQNLAHIVLVPLFGRLTREEQERAFMDLGPGRFKVILATNIAETSITIDNIQSVVDCGLSKLPWYNAQTGVTTLREEPVSRASATQRAGRAGRTGPGTVYRMYPESSWHERPDFTPEEILRIDLSEAVLRLISLGVRDVEKFPFPTPPPRGKLRAAVEALLILGAIDESRALTDIGRKMVPFPLSPPLARMVVEAGTRFVGALHDVLLVGAFLSVRSPFTYPSGMEEEARNAQARLLHPLGDAMTSITTFRKWQQAQDPVAFAKKYFLDNDTLAFVARAHAQLVDVASNHGLMVSTGAGEPSEILRCLVRGFADKVLIRRGFQFENPSGLRISLHPSSALYSQKAKFAVAAELMQAGRLYAFGASFMEPAWIKEANPHAARMWQLGGSKGRVESARPGVVTPPPARPSVPTSIVLNGQHLKVTPRGRRPLVEINLEQIRMVGAVSPSALPPDASRWRAQVTGRWGSFARGNLIEVLALATVASWPDLEAPVNLRVSLGTLLELDRNAHAIGRHLDHLGLAVQGPDWPQAGWLTLVSNDNGGFWYDVVQDFREAILTGVHAIEQLAEEDILATPIATTMRANRERLESLEKAVVARLEELRPSEFKRA